MSPLNCLVLSTRSTSTSEMGSSLGSSSNTLGFTPINTVFSPTTLPTANRSSQYVIKTLTDKKEIKSTLVEWTDYANVRLSESRAAKENSEEAMDNFLSDKTDLAKYTTVLGYIKNPHGKDTTADVKIFAAIDLEDRTQALASLRIYSDHVYLNGLATAPWNLSLSPNVIHTKEKVKGAGTSAFTATCNFAKTLHLQHVRTSPTGNSLSFYENQGMTHDKEKDDYVLIVNSAIHNKDS